MATVKRTFSIPDNISRMLNEAIPSKERSRFISQTIAKALEHKKREELLDALNNIKTWQPQEEPVVDTIRKIRQRPSG